VAAETGFNIDGTVYEVPMIDSLTTDEAQVLYDYSRLTLDDFVPPKDETAEEKHDREEILRNPGFLRALMHIAYQRAHPQMRAAKVRALVGAANFVSAHWRRWGTPSRTKRVATMRSPRRRRASSQNHRRQARSRTRPRRRRLSRRLGTVRRTVRTHGKTCPRLLLRRGRTHPPPSPIRSRRREAARPSPRRRGVRRAVPAGRWLASHRPRRQSGAARPGVQARRCDPPPRASPVARAGRRAGAVNGRTDWLSRRSRGSGCRGRGCASVSPPAASTSRRRPAVGSRRRCGSGRTSRCCYSSRSMLPASEQNEPRVFEEVERGVA
jgi:hypothetical protein